MVALPPPPPTTASREARGKRQHIRVSMPLTVELDGRSYAARDWSLGGFRIAGGHHPWRVGDRVTARLVFPFHGFALSLRAGCTATYVDAAAGMSGWRFSDVGEAELALLRHLFQAHVAGRVVEADGLLAAVRDHDPPPPPAGAAKAGLVARLRRAVGYAALLALGAGLAGAVALSAYGRFFTVEARHAAVSAPTVTVRAPADGRIEGNALAPGDPVARGARLFSVVNDDLRSRIRVTRAEIAKAEARLAALTRQRKHLAGFFDSYTDLARAELSKASAAHEAAVVALGAVERELARAERLHAEGHVSEQRLDALRSRQAAALRVVRQAEADLTQARANDRIARDGFYYTGSRVEGGTPEELATRITMAEQDLALLRAKLAALEDEQALLAQHSPCACVVDAVAAAPPEWVEAGAVVYRLRRTDPDALLVEAKISHDEAKRLRIGDDAAVRFADEDAVREGRIASIRHGPGRQPRSGLPEWLTLTPDLATVLVRVERPDLSAAVGLPAQVRFPLRPRLVLADWLGRDLPR